MDRTPARSSRISRSIRSLAFTLVVAGFAAAMASPASANVLDTDRPKITAQQLDFGENWFVSGPLNGGHLDWDFTSGVVTPDLDGTLFINNAPGVCARMQMEYHDMNHNVLATKNGLLRCATDGSRQEFTVNMHPYASGLIDHVIIRLQVQNANGTFSNTGTKTEYFD